MTSPLITTAANLLRAGRLVAFPTETVYGLGADARNEAAVCRIFQVKERPYNHPLIVHIARLEQLAEWAVDVSPDALKLAHAFWPGPLTIILKKQPHVLDRVTGGQETVGLRIPNHPIAQALLQAFGDGIAAPSANKFTHVSTTTAAAVREELGDEVDLILDGGASEVGLESTIIDMSHAMPVILRPGRVSAQEIAAVLSMPILFSRQDAHETRAPGMYHLHYAPVTKTSLIETGRIADWIKALKPEELPIAFVVYSPGPWRESEKIHWVNMPSDPQAYAHDLYQTLRSLDHQHFKRIMMEAVPKAPAWDAIRDRLLKASGSI